MNTIKKVVVNISEPYYLETTKKETRVVFWNNTISGVSSIVVNHSERSIKFNKGAIYDSYCHLPIRIAFTDTTFLRVFIENNILYIFDILIEAYNNASNN